MLSLRTLRLPWTRTASGSLITTLPICCYVDITESVRLRQRHYPSLLVHTTRGRYPGTPSTQFSSRNFESGADCHALARAMFLFFPNSTWLRWAISRKVSPPASLALTASGVLFLDWHGHCIVRVVLFSRRGDGYGIGWGIQRPEP